MAANKTATTSTERVVKTPRERFREVGPKRLAKARLALNSIKMLGTRGYQFSPAEAERIAQPLIKDLEDAVTAIRAYSASGGAKQAKAEQPEFEFDEE